MTTCASEISRSYPWKNPETTISLCIIYWCVKLVIKAQGTPNVVFTGQRVKLIVFTMRSFIGIQNRHGHLNKQKIIIITKIKYKYFLRQETVLKIFIWIGHRLSNSRRCEGWIESRHAYVCFRTVTGGQSTQKAATQAQLQHLNSIQQRPGQQVQAQKLLAVRFYYTFFFFLKDDYYLLHISPT